MIDSDNGLAAVQCQTITQNSDEQVLDHPGISKWISIVAALRTFTYFLFQVFVKRLKKAVAKNDANRAHRLRQNKPKYKLDHIVKERYELTHCGLVTTQDWFNIGSGNGWLPDGTKPLPEPTLTYR